MRLREYTRFREASQGPAHRWWVLAAVECGNFVVYMDGFIVTLALPAMARQFGVGIHEIKWVLVAYLAALGSVEVLAWAPGAMAGGPSLDAYVQAQAFAFRVGAALGLVGAVISALRGSEVPSAPPPGARRQGPT